MPYLQNETERVRAEVRAAEQEIARLEQQARTGDEAARQAANRALEAQRARLAAAQETLRQVEAMAAAVDREPLDRPALEALASRLAALAWEHEQAEVDLKEQAATLTRTLEEQVSRYASLTAERDRLASQATAASTALQAASAASAAAQSSLDAHLRNRPSLPWQMSQWLARAQQLVAVRDQALAHEQQARSDYETRRAEYLRASGAVAAMEPGLAYLRRRLQETERQRSIFSDRAAEHRAARDAVTTRLLGEIETGHPLVLLPVRLETRFMKDAAGSSQLLVRIYPDDLHADAHEPELTADEKVWGSHFVEQNAADADPAADPESTRQRAWEQLAERFGTRRAAWIARRFDATPPEQLSEPDSTWTRTARTNVLPDRWAAIAYPRDAGRPVVAWSEQIPPSLPLSPLHNSSAEGNGGTPPGVDDDPEGKDGLPPAVDEELRWLVDLETALTRGMALRIPLTTAQAEEGFERLVVVGVRAGLDAEASAGRLASLLDAHHYTSGLALVPQGTPTNNTEEVSSGYRTGDETTGDWGYRVERGPSLALPGADGVILARALGTDASIFAHVHNADGREQASAAAMNRALWPATGAWWLGQPLTLTPPGEGDGGRSTAWREHFVGYVRARGPLPAFRVGNQPYGVLPVISLQRWQPPVEGATPTEIVDALRAVARSWERARVQVLALGLRGNGADDGRPLPGWCQGMSLEDLLEIVGSQEAISHGYALRRFAGNTRFAEPWVAIARDPADPAASFALGQPEPNYVRLLRESEFEAIRTERYPGWEVGSTPRPHPLLYLLLRRAALVALAPGGDASTAAAFRDALRKLEELPDSALRTLMAETLDSCTYRFDVWVTSLATARLEHLRENGSQGILLGGYGWVEDLRPGSPLIPISDEVAGEDGTVFTSRAAGGFVQAPSLAHASTAAVLRSRYILEKTAEGGEAFGIDLSSVRVRQAQWLLDGMRQGQSLGALLGYRFERALHENRLDHYIYRFRTLGALGDDSALAPRFQTLQRAFQEKRALDAEVSRLEAEEQASDREVLKEERSIGDLRQRRARAEREVTRIEDYVARAQEARAAAARLEEEIDRLRDQQPRSNDEGREVDLVGSEEFAAWQQRLNELGARRDDARDSAQRLEARYGREGGALAAAREEMSATDLLLSEAAAREREQAEIKQELAHRATIRRADRRARVGGIEALRAQLGADVEERWRDVSESLAARNVVDGSDLYRRFRLGRQSGIWDGTTIPFGTPGLGFPSEEDLEYELLTKLLRELERAVDAVGDATVAESVYQLVQGNPMRSGAALDAISPDYVFGSEGARTSPTRRLPSPKTGDHLYTTSESERDRAMGNLGYRFEGVACFVFGSQALETIPLYRLARAETSDHLYTTSQSERDTAVSTLGYRPEGVACYVFDWPAAGTTPLYRLARPEIGDHVYTTSASERDNAVNALGYRPQGVACHVFGPQGTGSIPLYRLFNGQTGDHFYTTYEWERDVAQRVHGYVLEGVACFIFGSQATGTLPLYRLWNPNVADHLYTTSASERDTAKRVHGYLDEGIACYIFGSQGAGRSPLYRLYNQQTNDHLYTTSASERDTAKGVHGYLDEGIACYIFGSQGAGTIPLYRLWNPGTESGDTEPESQDAEAERRPNASVLPPTELDVVRTPRTGVALTHRVLALFDSTVTNAAAWATDVRSARAEAEPLLNGWVATLLPEPARVRCHADYVERGSSRVIAADEVSLHDIGLAPLDVVFLARGDEEAQRGELEQRLVYLLLRRYAQQRRETTDDRPRSADVDVRLTFAQATGEATDLVSFAELLEVARKARKLVAGTRYVRPTDLALSDVVAEMGPLEVDEEELRPRIHKAEQSMTETLGLLQDASRPEATIGQMQTALLRAGQFGIMGAIPRFPFDADPQAHAAALARAREAQSEANAAQREAERLAARLAELQGRPRPPARTIETVRRERAAALARAREARAEANAAQREAEELDVAPESRTALQEQVASVCKETERRREQLDALESEAHLDADLARVAAIFGPDFRVLPRLKPRPGATTDLKNAFDRSGSFLGNDPLAPVTWLQRASRVRVGLSLLDDSLLYAEAIGGRARLASLSVGQLPHDESDRWIALKHDGDGSIPGGRLSLVVHLPPGVERPDFEEPMAGLLIDEWVEVVPGRSETTGLTFHFDQPDARAPQAILLAVPPDERRPAWDLDTLATVLHETFDLAQIRAVDPLALTPPETVPLYRLWKPEIGDHVYTTSEEERDSAVSKLGYRSEGVACYVFDWPAPGTTPLYRLAHRQVNEHLYTTSEWDRDDAVSNLNYRFEGVACYVFDWPAAGATPLYQLWTPGNSDHLYTTSENERDNAIENLNYRFEGEACYVFAEAGPSLPPAVWFEEPAVADPRLSELARAATPQLQVGEEVALRCLGFIEGNRFLEGRPSDGGVRLAPSTSAPSAGTRWRVGDGGGGAITLECLDRSPGSHFLDGRTPDGTVGLAPITSAPYTGTRWRVGESGGGAITLECLGHLPGSRFLDGRTPDGSVRLAPSISAPYTGTGWQVIR